jgi:hypothetical protein
MAVILNRRSYDHAQKLIKDGLAVHDDRDQWSEHQPSTQRENEFIDQHGIDEYARWYLGIDDEQAEGRKGRYKYPYGDFERVHRCGVLSAEVRAAQRRHADIEVAAAHLHGMLDGSS